MVWYPNSQGRFGARGAKGDLGEAIVSEYCKINNIPFEDKNDRTSQVILKIDCLINGIPVDVKSNYYKGRLAVELWTKNNQPGWLFNTTAEQIYGVDVDTKSIYRYNIEDMIDYVSKNEHRAKKTKYDDTVLWAPVALDIIEKLQ
jgi:hypothetical protein